MASAIALCVSSHTSLYVLSHGPLSLSLLFPLTAEQPPEMQQELDETEEALKREHGLLSLLRFFVVSHRITMACLLCNNQFSLTTHLAPFVCVFSVPILFSSSIGLLRLILA